MTKRERLSLAYKTTERLHLLPILKEEIEAIVMSLELVREEDLK